MYLNGSNKMYLNGSNKMKTKTTRLLEQLEYPIEQS